MRYLIFIAIFGLAACSAAKKASDSSSVQTAHIHTSAQCGMCETTIENAFKDVAGVTLADLDVTTAKLKVKYNPAKINLDQIRQIVANAGYDADDVAANPAVYEKLPACCKKGGGH
jgi:copper chaperone CopZ